MEKVTWPYYFNCPNTTKNFDTLTLTFDLNTITNLFYNP